MSRHSSSLGRQHDLDTQYLTCVAAIDYGLAHDDAAAASFDEADVILAGASRTSKTPPSVYLACRWVKAANLPLMPGRTLLEGFTVAGGQGSFVDGPTIAAVRLAEIRRNRLETFGASMDGRYADLTAIRAELVEARLTFAALGALVIDVTRRSVEETAATVMAKLRARAAV